MAGSAFILIMRLVGLVMILGDISLSAHAVDANPLSMKTFWDDENNDTQLCHLKEKNYSRQLAALFSGSAHRTCSLQVNVSLGYHVRIDAVLTSQEQFFFYIERKGELMDCTNKYIAFDRNTEACSAILLQDRLQINLQGNASILIRGISAPETARSCPESYDQVSSLIPANTNHTPNCNRVKGYINQITCDFDYNDRCRLTFPPNCNATLLHREVMFQCTGELQSQESLVIYPIDTSFLDLSYNNIVKLDMTVSLGFNNLQRPNSNYSGNTDLQSFNVFGLYNLNRLYINANKLTQINVDAFQSLTSLTHLKLNNNVLTTLPIGLFEGLENLFLLYLYSNQLVSLNASTFSGLGRLSYLALDDNKLVTLPINVFIGLNNLTKLWLYGNQLVMVSDITFNGLNRLTYLSLRNNKLTLLPSNLFKGLDSLLDLYVQRNQLGALDESTFHGLGKLQYLSLRDNKLRDLPMGLFKGLVNLNKLYLYGNNLTALNSNMFNGLDRLTLVYLHRNILTTLSSSLFQGLGNLIKLFLYENRLVTLNDSTFQGLGRLNELSLRDNVLRTLPSSLFRRLESLVTLYLDGNHLVTLPSGLFEGLGNLQELSLDRNRLIRLHPHIFLDLKNLRSLLIGINRLESLPSAVFNNLSNLDYLSLHSNQIKSLSPGIFQGLFQLRVLNMKNNTLRHLESDIFRDIVNITYIRLSENQLKDCPDIRKMTRLTLFDLRNNTLTEITRGTFSGLPTNSELAVSQHEICECYVLDGVKCSASDNRSPYLTCDRLLSDRVLVVLMWLIGINALGGNIFVLVWRKVKTKKYKVQDLLLSNLAMADLLMGVYMVTIASADMYYGDLFPMQSEIWRSGITCRVAGALSIASTELSVLFLVLISIDRFICIKYPYSNKKLGIMSTSLISLLIWICSLALGVFPSILAGRNFRFYDNSHVCIGLPLALTKTYSNYVNSTVIAIDNLSFPRNTFTTTFTGLTNGLYFSTALFLGLNGLCYLIILWCYIEIVRAVTKSAKQSGRTPDMDEQIRLTSKVTAIVATDFMCISPVIVLGILVQTRVIELPPSVYAWSVTFVLPINSAINPYLYTIAEIISSNRKKKENKTIQQSMALQSLKM